MADRLRYILIRQAGAATQTEYLYDALDRLIGVVPPTGSPANYRYGPTDLRTAVIWAGEETRFHYDGERLILESNSIGNPQRHYSYTSVGLLNYVVIGSQARGAHLDGQASPVAITASDGSLVSRTRFDAFGRETPSFGARDQRVSYQGYWSEPVLAGIQLSAARIYLPSLGFFAERDPVEGSTKSPAEFNPYLMGRGNPMRWQDPDGRYAEAGHYYTTYYAALRVGLSDTKAARLATYSQLFDEVDRYDGIGTQVDRLTMVVVDPCDGECPNQYNLIAAKHSDALEQRDMVHIGGHGLTGRNAQRERLSTLRAQQDSLANEAEYGLLIHRLGDNYAHTDGENAHGTGSGHLFDSLFGIHPDLIQDYPDRYNEYTQVLGAELAAYAGYSSEEAYKIGKEISAELSSIASIEREVRADYRVFSVFGSTVSVRTAPIVKSDAQMEEESVARLIAMIQHRGGAQLLSMEQYPRGGKANASFFPFISATYSEFKSFVESGSELVMPNEDEIQSAIKSIFDKTRLLREPYPFGDIEPSESLLRLVD